MLRALFGIATVLLSLLSSTALAEKDEAERPRFGKALLAEYELPAEAIERFNAFQPPEPAKHGSPLENILLADTEGWLGPALNVSSTSNPHTIVVRARGRAKQSGHASAMWHAGWQLEEGEMRQGVLLTVADAPAESAGQAIELTGTAPTSFRDNRTLAVALGLVSTTNFEFEQVKVEVWSGIAASGWTDNILSMQGALVGLAMFALVLWFRRR